MIPTSTNDLSKEWQDAIQTALDYVFSGGVGRAGRFGNNDTSATHASLDYFSRLEEALMQVEESNWSLPPKDMPPPFSAEALSEMMTPLPPSSNLQQQHMLTNGRASKSASKSVRRLMVRVLNAEAEVLARMAADCRQARPMPQWMQGAGHCSTAVSKTFQAQNIADLEISRNLMQATNGDFASSAANREEHTGLVEDADIIDVTVRSLIGEKDRFWGEAKRQEQRLERRLQPQWESRDEVKLRMGTDRWCNNPNPKRDYAEKRERDESQLKEIQIALQHLQELDMDSLEANAANLKNKLMGATDPRQALANQNRYNCIRPIDISVRVPYDDYPDPTEFGWNFTGSIEESRVEFFEIKDTVQHNGGSSKGIIKLDWYYSTATVKTSMDHPTQGRTQLFASGADITPDLYREILQNPRTHTGIRYQTNRGRRSNNGRGRGRGRGRGGGRGRPRNNYNG